MGCDFDVRRQSVGFRFCHCLALSIILFKRHDWCWMFLLADMQNVPNIAIFVEIWPIRAIHRGENKVAALFMVFGNMFSIL